MASIISVDNVVVGESDSTAIFTITLDQASDTDITVSYATAAATASASADYLATSGSLTFAVGETVKTVAISLVSNTLSELVESFLLTLSSPSSGATIGRPVGVATVLDNDTATGTPVIQVSNLIVDESAHEAYMVVSLDRPSTSIVTMNYATTDGSATAGTDYQAVAGSLSFAAGEMSKTVKVPLLNDGLPEWSETFSLTLSNVSNASLPDSTATVTIAAHPAATTDLSVITVEDVVVSEGDGYVDFIVRLDVPNTETVTVNYATTAGNAQASIDYMAQGGQLAFGPGETVKTVRVVIEDNTSVETVEGFLFSLTGASANAQIGRPIAIASILDDDGATGTPIVSVSDAVVDEGSREAVFVISLDRPSTGAVSLNYATAEEFAYTTDFKAVSGTVSFAPGERVKEIRVPLVDDASTESAGTFKLNLSGVSGATLPDNQGVAIIERSDFATVSTSNISIDDAIASEGSGYVDFVVTLDAPNSELVTVNYSTVAGSAFAGSSGDYMPQSGTITFAAGQTRQTIRLELSDNATAEGLETFAVTLSGPSGNATIGRSVGQALIVDNDGATGTPVVMVHDLVLDESARVATFTVTLDRPSTSLVTMDYSTVDEAQTSGSFLPVSGKLAFAPGEMVKTVSVVLLNDDVGENSSALHLALTGVSGATLPDGRADLLIAQNDLAVQSTSIIHIENVVVGEGDGWAEVIVRLDAPNNEAVTVNYATVAATASASTAGEYMAQGGMLTFAAGEVLKTVRIGLVDDTTVERATSFNVVLSGPSANALLGNTVGVVTLVDDDGTTGTPAIRVSDAIVDDAAGEAVFVLTLDRPTTNTVTVNFATENGSALAGSDYALTSGTVAFAPGEMTRTVRVPVLVDGLSENSESFKLLLSGASGATLPDNAAVATIGGSVTTSTGQAMVSIDDVIVDEKTGYADFIVRLDAPSAEIVTVNYATTAGSADAGGSDYVGQSGSLAFAAGETTKVVRIIVADNTSAEQAENFIVSLSGVSTNAVIGRPVGVATIVDNDGAAGTPVVQVSNVTVDEGGHEAVFVISLDRPATGVVSLDYTTANSVSADYGPVSGKIAFAAGEMVKEVRVNLVNDTVSEEGESFTLVLSNVVGATLPDNTVTGSIVRNDATAQSHSVISVQDVLVNEGDGYVDFVVRLDLPNEGLVTVNYATAAASAGSGSDYVAQGGTIAFAAGETLKTIRVGLVDNTTAEAREGFVMSLTGASTNATIGRAVGTATIIDDDATAGTPALSISLPLADEVNGGAKVTFTLDKPATAPVSFTYTVNGLTTGSTDFGAVSGQSIAFAPGEMVKTINIGITNDGLSESPEVLEVLVTNLSGATLAAGDHGNVVIGTSDGAAAASPLVYVQDAAAGEANGFIDFVVNLSAPSTSEVTVNYTTVAGTANSGSDYAGLAGSITFAPGETTQVIRVIVADDTTVESTETLSLTLTSAINGTLGNTSAVGYILDSDSTPSTNVALNGSGVANTLRGTGRADLLIGLQGNDVLIGRQGDDTMTGGAGNDTYLVEDSGDVVVEVGLGGTDLVVSYAENYTLAAQVENLRMGGLTVAGAGNELNNVITGNAAANVLTGHDGFDTINGGTGADTMVGGTGNDTYYVSDAGDVVTELADEGTDTVYASRAYALTDNVETLRLLDGVVTGTGNALGNLLVGNDIGNRLIGNAGNDVHRGGLGADTMVGGLGNDTYEVDDTGDVVTETSAVGGGTDTVRSTITYKLGAYVENLVLLGSDAINGTGNLLDNNLSGNDAANVLNGSGGADRMNGELGDDTYYVDNVGDEVIESINGGTDTVRSSIDHTLVLRAENLVLTGTADIDGTGTVLNNAITGNAGANVLLGGGGIDKIKGGAGNDTVNGGSGSDFLYGGADADTFVFDSLVGSDSVRDFDGTEDTLSFSASVFTALGSAGALNAALFHASATTTGSSSASEGAGLYYNTTTGALYYDADGFGGSAANKVATLTGVPALAAGDIIVG